MICKPCAAAADATAALSGDSFYLHTDCLGPTWCDCQHRVGGAVHEVLESMRAAAPKGAQLRGQFDSPTEVRVVHIPAGAWSTETERAQMELWMQEQGIDTGPITFGDGYGPA
jgi:hypothetical protein